MDSRTTGVTHGARRSGGQDDAEFGFPAHHARVGVRGFLERILFYDEKKLTALSEPESQALDDESLAYDDTLRNRGHFVAVQKLESGGREGDGIAISETMRGTGRITPSRRCRTGSPKRTGLRG
jgi:hypothetical protein